jgi:hypothetical protein
MKVPEKTATSASYRLEDVEEFLKKLEKEDAMIDDHGQAIIGGRDRQPRDSLKG